MRDYMLAIGQQTPYGFSAGDDHAALLHAADYVARHDADASLLVLSGPDGIMTSPAETAGSLRGRVAALDPFDDTDDVRPGDPTPPDCNTA